MKRKLTEKEKEARKLRRKLRKEFPVWLRNIPPEVESYLENAIADGIFQNWKDITKEFALEEAQYVLNTFKEPGHDNHYRLTKDNDDPEDRKAARSEMKKIERYIARVEKA